MIDVEGFGDRLSASWAEDGKTYLLSGNGHGPYSTIVEVNRETLEQTLLLDGESEGLSFLYAAQNIQDGIVFLAMRDEDLPPQFPPYLPHQLFFSSINNGVLEYILVKQMQICEEDVDGISWALSFEWGFLICNSQHSHNFKVVTPNWEIIDITSMLSEFVDKEIMDVVWSE